MQTHTCEVELLRGKGYPQTEDDPNPCTTQVKVSVLDESGQKEICREQSSSIQENSNAPFYKDVLSFELGEISSTQDVVLFLKVYEFSRKKEPFVMFFGVQKFRPDQFKSRKEITLSLGSVNPIEENGESQPPSSADESETTINMRLIVTKNIVKEEGDPFPDVDINGGIPFNGSCPIVPEGSEYIWLRLLNDKRWGDSFRNTLISTWKGMDSLEKDKEPKPKIKPSNARGTRGEAAAPEPALSTIGAVITKKWCCRRAHQILTRLRLTAEKYCEKADLTFTAEEEVEFRKTKKQRAQLLVNMSIEALKKDGNSKLRDWLERLWVLFAVGIDNDPSGSKTLSYDMRKKVYDTPFDDEDAVVVQACLLHLLVPSLAYDFCQGIIEEEVRFRLEKELLTDTTDGNHNKHSGGKSEPKITHHQERFTSIVVEFFGSMLDTITEAELLRAAKALKPAIFDAQQKISKGAKTEITARIRPDSAYRSAYKGDGINIAHLDKLGNRKKKAAFT